MSSEIYPGSIDSLSDREAYYIVLGQIDEQVVAIEALRTLSAGPAAAEHERKIGIDTAIDRNVWHSGPRHRECLGYVPIDGVGVCPAAAYRIGDGVPQMYIRTPNSVFSRCGDRPDEDKGLEGAEYMLDLLKELHGLLEVYPPLRLLDRKLGNIMELPSTLAV